MSVPGTAADVSISCSDSISTVPGTGPVVWKDPLDFRRTPLPAALPEVATLDIVRTAVSDFSAMRTRTMSKVARPAYRALTLRVGGGICNLQSAICISQFAIRNGRAGDLMAP
jgi:hypothetical protein